MYPVFIILYVILAVLVAYDGRFTTVGFWGMLILSLLFTPFIVFALRHLLSNPSTRRQGQG